MLSPSDCGCLDLDRPADPARAGHRGQDRLGYLRDHPADPVRLRAHGRRFVVTRSFADLVDEAAKADVTGWEFSWLDGRASEQRPSWGYAAMMAERMAAASAALDVQTGGGEVLASVPKRPA